MKWKSARELGRQWEGDIVLRFGGSCVSTGLAQVAPALVLVAQLAGFALMAAFPVPELTRNTGSGAFAAILVALAVACVSTFVATATIDPGLLPRCTGAGLASHRDRPPRVQQLNAHGVS